MLTNKNPKVGRFPEVKMNLRKEPSGGDSEQRRRAYGDGRAEAEDSAGHHRRLHPDGRSGRFSHDQQEVRHGPVLCDHPQRDERPGGAGLSGSAPCFGRADSEREGLPALRGQPDADGTDPGRQPGKREPAFYRPGPPDGGRHRSRGQRHFHPDEVHRGGGSWCPFHGIRRWWSS